MSEEVKIKKSLQEIAQLLLLIHESYVLHYNGFTISIQLYKFTSNIGLNDKISIFDIEYIRNNTCNGNDSMNYEVFYNFLKQLSIYIYKPLEYNDKNIKKSFHSLLTKHIIPYTAKNLSNNDLYLSESDIIILNSINIKSLNTITKYKEFLKLWYVNMFLKPSKDQLRLTPFESSWKYMASNNTREIVIQQLIHSFNRINISNIIDINRIFLIIKQILLLSNQIDISLQSINFIQFVHIIISISNNIRLSHPLDKHNNDSFVDNYLERFILFIITNMYSNSICLFIESVNDINTRRLTTESILWIVRQVGITQFYQSDLTWIYQCICDKTKRLNTSTNYISIDQLPYLLSDMLKQLSNIPDISIYKTIGYTDDELHLIYLSIHLPNLLFVSNKFPATSLQLLYSKEGINVIDNNIKIIQTIYQSLITTNSLTIHHLNEYLVNFEIIPTNYNILNKILIIVTNSQDNDMYEFILNQSFSLIDLIEILFVISNDVISETTNLYDKFINFLSMITSNSRIDLISLSKSNISTSEQPIITSSIDKVLGTSIYETKQLFDDILDESIHPSYILLSNAVLNEDNIENSDPLTNSLRDIMILLIFYPNTSFHYNLWEIAQIFLNYSRYEGNPIRSNQVDLIGDNRTLLSNIFIYLTKQYNITIDSLIKFFSLRYEKSDILFNDSSYKMTLKSSIHQSIHQPLYYLLFNENTLRLLYSNCELLKFEFSRCFSIYRNHNIITNDKYIHSLPVDYLMDNSVYNNYLIPQNTAVKWANEFLSIDMKDIETSLIDINILSIEYNCQYMNFSIFVLFAIRCFYVIRYKVNSVVYSTNNIDFTQEIDITGVVRDLLTKISNNLTFIQQRLSLRILYPLYQYNPINQIDDLTVDTNAENNKLIDFQIDNQLDKNKDKYKKHSIYDNTSINNIIIKSLEFYQTIMKSKYKSNYISSYKYIPPNPPSILWDAPRFITYCKYLGITTSVKSLVSLWYSYGLYSNKIKSSSWSNNVVNPLPVKIDSEIIINLLNSISKLCYENNNDSSIKYNNINYIASKIVLPILCYHNDPLNYPITSIITDSSNVSIEDILRFGGDVVVQYLDNIQVYINESYSYLCRLTKSIEPTINIVCNYLYCYGLLKKSTVGILTKRSLHPRIRSINLNDNINDINIITITRYEYEEVVLRCGLFLWDLINKSQSYSNNNSNIFISQYQQSELPSDLSIDILSKLINIYSNHFITSNINNENSNINSWGTNFLEPYINTLISKIDDITIDDKPSVISNNNDRFVNKYVEAISTKQLASQNHTTVNKIVKKENDMNNNVISERSNHSKLPDILLSGRYNHTISDPLIRSTNKLDKSHSHDNFDDKILTTNSLTSLDVISNQPISPSNLNTEANNQNVIVEQVNIGNTINKLLDGTKEVLWPVYATYCSCGDSIEPGKLSGPNLFTLLSKLGILTNETILSDLGILLHQISSHTHAYSPLAIANMISPNDVFDSPSLSFEEFLIFLCVFAQLKYEGNINIPTFINDNTTDKLDLHYWLNQWTNYMSTSTHFKHLLEECILPVLKKHPVLAFPEDARHRDNYSSIFSLEVLLAIEGSERSLQLSYYKYYNLSKDITNNIKSIIGILKQINLIPQIINDMQVRQLINDVLPNQANRNDNNTPIIVFPQWEWIISVIAYIAVDTAVIESPIPTDQSKIPGLVAGLITSISEAIKSLR